MQNTRLEIIGEKSTKSLDIGWIPWYNSSIDSRGLSMCIAIYIAIIPSAKPCNITQLSRGGEKL